MSNRSKMAKSAIAMSMISVVSLAFSFLKESVFAYYFGASSMTDAFTIAIQIPTTLFSLVSTAIGNVALPYYAREMANSGEEKASRYVSNLMTIVTLLSITIVATLELIPGIVISVFAPGLSTESSYLAASLLRLVLPTVVLTELININTAVMNVNKSFVLPSLGSLVLNLAFVTTVACFAKAGGIYVAAWGTALGTVIEFGYSVLLRRKYLKYGWVCDIRDSDLIASVRKAVPIFVGIGAAEINKMVDTLVSSYLQPGAISMLNYGSKLSSAFSTLLVNSITTVVYPEFAESIALKDDARLADSLVFSLRLILLIMLPVMVGGSILSREIITIVYRRGAFSAETVDGTAPIFAAYLLCLLFIAIRQVSSRAFYAYGDTKTPMKNSLIGIAINIVLDLSVVKFFGAIGLALATTTANAVISILVLAELKKKNGSIDYIKIKSLVVRIVVACLFMAIAISFGRYFIVSCNLLNLATFGGATMFILLSVVLGSGVYSGCLLLMKTEELLMVIQTILRRKP